MSARFSILTKAGNREALGMKLKVRAPDTGTSRILTPEELNLMGVEFVKEMSSILADDRKVRDIIRGSLDREIPKWPPADAKTILLYREGGQFCALLGDNLQSGDCGFGSTPAAALLGLARELRDYQGMDIDSVEGTVSE